MFAAGDATSSTSFVIEAVAAGHKAAATSMRIFAARTVESGERRELRPVVKLDAAEVSGAYPRGRDRA